MGGFEQSSCWLESAEYDLQTAHAMLETRRLLYVGIMCYQVVEEELFVLVPLICCLVEPILGCGIVLFHVLSQKIRLAQKVLSLYAALPDGIGKVPRRFNRVLFRLSILEVELAQLVTGKLITALHSLLVPGYRFPDPPLPMHDLCQRILRIAVPISAAQ